MKLEQVISRGAHSLPPPHVRAPRGWGRSGSPSGTGCGGPLEIGGDARWQELRGRLESRRQDASGLRCTCRETSACAHDTAGKAGLSGSGHRDYVAVQHNQR